MGGAFRLRTNIPSGGGGLAKRSTHTVSSRTPCPPPPARRPTDLATPMLSPRSQTTASEQPCRPLLHGRKGASWCRVGFRVVARSSPNRASPWLGLSGFRGGGSGVAGRGCGSGRAGRPGRGGGCGWWWLWRWRFSSSPRSAGCCWCSWFWVPSFSASPPLPLLARPFLFSSHDPH
jgi:hypothetical protein